MNMNKKKKAIWHSKRATFEDVGIAQTYIRQLIEECIRENRPLNLAERERFIDVFRKATLGLGSKYKYRLYGRKKIYYFENIGEAAYRIAKLNDSIVDLGYEKLPIKVFWHELLSHLLRLFPEVDKMSVEISRELEKKHSGEGVDIDSI